MTEALNHISFIPDGNRRWAESQNVSQAYAYEAGAERIREVITRSFDASIHTATVWGLSTENWQHRSRRELKLLTKLFTTITNAFLEDVDEDAKIVHLGRKDRLPTDLLERISELEARTQDSKGHIINLALDYGGQDELRRATKKIAQAAMEGTVDIRDLDKPSKEGRASALYANFLDTAGQPYPCPDYIIRTSGEKRLSGFMPWQSVYSELYFADCLWPDFDSIEFDRAIDEYSTRIRRYGGDNS